MPPFEYRPYRNPYVNSISDLMERQGQIPAQAAQQIGQAQVNAALQSGQAWAGAANQIGQGISGAIQQAIDPRRKLEALQVEQAQQGRNDLSALDKAFTQPGGRDAIIQALPGHLRPTVMKQFADADSAAATVQETQLKAESATTGYVQTLAEIAKAHGYDPSALQLSLSHAADTFKTNPSLLSQVRQFQTALQQNPTPDTVKSIVDPILAAKDAQEKPVILPATPRGGAPAQLVRPSGGAPIATGQLAPAQPPTPASIALDAAGGDPVKANILLHPEAKKNPPSVQEQLLEAITKGDTATADNITKTLRMEATARQDPAAAQLANQLRNLSVEQATERLKKVKEENAPIDVSADVNTTGSGRKYIDLSLYSAGQRDKARSAAEKSGALAVSKEQADSLQQIDNARMNQSSIMTQITDLLPKDASGRPLAAVDVALSKLFQTNDQVAAFGSWRTAAINSMRATAGSKGLRINRAEIEQAIENDIPKLTDTLGAAKQKVANVNTMLENAEKSILVRDRSTTTAAPDPVKSVLSGKGPGRYTLSDGSQWVIDGTGMIRPGS